MPVEPRQVIPSLLPAVLQLQAVVLVVPVLVIVRVPLQLVKLELHQFQSIKRQHHSKHHFRLLPQIQIRSWLRTLHFCRKRSKPTLPYFVRILDH